MGNQRKVYSEEFKREDVELSLRPDKTVKEIAENLGINASVLTRWRSEYRNGGSFSFPGRRKQRLTPEEEENKALKKELADLNCDSQFKPIGPSQLLQIQQIHVKCNR